MHPGDKVRFIGCNKNQIRWGNCDDPKNKLFEGDIYKIKSISVHNWHTKLEIYDVEGKFNSVCFEEIEDD